MIKDLFHTEELSPEQLERIHGGFFGGCRFVEPFGPEVARNADFGTNI
jgi:hypothetical protein